MAKKNALNKPAITLADFEKDGFLFQESIGNKYNISNIILKDYYRLFENETIDASPRYQRPYNYNDNDGSGGSLWQRNLIGAFIKGEFIQPLHLRFRDDKLKIDFSESKNFYVIELLDGGHRTRTICNFIAGKLKTPQDFYIILNGTQYDCSDRYFNELKEVVRNYILSQELTICVHFNLSDDQAGETFRTLNNLHNMSNQEKRSSYYKHIAHIVRSLGAVDTSYYDMFNKITISKNITSLKYLKISLENDSRATDEYVAILFHIFSNMKKGNINAYFLPNAKQLDSMYESDASEDFDISKSYYNHSTEVYQRVNRVLEFINKLVIENTDSNVTNFGKEKLTKGGLLKLALFFDWILSKNPKLTINKFNPEVFWKKIFDTINLIEIPHIEYQTYKIVNNEIEIDEPGEKDAKVIPSAWKVWGTGSRLDDIQYILFHLIVKFDIVEWGFTKAKKDNLREFTAEQRQQLYKQQNGLCRRTGKSLKDIKPEADHIIPHSYGAPTIVENGQLICAEVNGNKSSGVTIDDVKLVCKRMGYKKVDSLIDMFETDTSELLPEDIEMVVKKVFK